MASLSVYSTNNRQYFDTGNWLTGVSPTAIQHAVPKVVAVILRNELRAATGQNGNKHKEQVRIHESGNASHQCAQFGLVDHVRARLPGEARTRPSAKHTWYTWNA